MKIAQSYYILYIILHDGCTVRGMTSWRLLLYHKCLLHAGVVSELIGVQCDKSG